MADKFRIDSHKLIFHPQRVADWQAGKNIYPLYMEVSPTGGCNHRCTYCALDFMEYQKRNLDTQVFKERLIEMGQLGLKSIMFAGEGEPFLHPDMVEITKATKAAGIDPSFTTNASKITPEVAREILPVTSWIKVSINGATEETYHKIHRAKRSDYQAVIDNLAYAAEYRKESGSKCTLGMQLLLLPENQPEAVDLAKLAKKIGMDYLVIKPYSQHPLSKTEIYKDIRYEGMADLARELEAVNGDGFNVVFRSETMSNWDAQEHKYGVCQALPFWSYMDAGGNLWACSMYLGDEKFSIGNAMEKTFKEIWEGEARKKNTEFVANELDIKNCRVNCRMDKVNAYLWELKNPGEHVNFI